MFILWRNRALIAFILFISHGIYALSPEAREKGFVYLHEIDPSIQVSLRYYSDENFLGARVDGYHAAVVVIHEKAAHALKEVQKDVQKDGYSLVVYDAYRPQRAVNHFMRWSEDVSDQIKKAHYYPRVNKADVFELGYVARRSGHSRGSTVDLTLIKKGDVVHEVIVRERVLRDGFNILFLDDGTVDMGSSFDLFDRASHITNNLIAPEHITRRTYLQKVMKRHGFKEYSEEWWHFTLKNEPYPAHLESSYFNFPVE